LAIGFIVVYVRVYVVLANKVSFAWLRLSVVTVAGVVSVTVSVLLIWASCPPVESYI